MNPSLLELELPVITCPDKVAPLVTSEEALRWRIAKRRHSKDLPRDKPQGEPFVWIEKHSPSSGQ